MIAGVGSASPVEIGLVFFFVPTEVPSRSSAKLACKVTQKPPSKLHEFGKRFARGFGSFADLVKEPLGKVLGKHAKEPGRDADAEFQRAIAWIGPLDVPGMQAAHAACNARICVSKSSRFC